MASYIHVYTQVLLSRRKTCSIQDTFKLLFLFVFVDMHNAPYLLGHNIFSSVSTVQTIVENWDSSPLQPDQALQAG